jgi:hypothetical protein
MKAAIEKQMANTIILHNDIDQNRHAINEQNLILKHIAKEVINNLKKGFIESAKWIRDVLAKNMQEKMMNEPNKSKFELLMLAKKRSVYLGARACASFNRGEECHQGRWHITQKRESLRDRLGSRTSGELEDDSRYPSQDQHSRKSELRLHACTLCIEALGAAFGHSVLDCPWILKKNWIE